MPDDLRASIRQLREHERKPMTETPLQQYLRNHGENVRLMRARAIEMVRDGRSDLAERINRIADAWEQIGKVAERQEGQ